MLGLDTPETEEAKGVKYRNDSEKESLLENSAPRLARATALYLFYEV